MARLPGILEMVSRIEDGPYYTISQVATMIGRDADTIRRWTKKNPELAPQYRMNLGSKGSGAFVWLYDDEDVKKFKEYALTVKVGRPRKEEEK